jgi:hypothetical protein
MMNLLKSPVLWAVLALGLVAAPSHAQGPGPTANVVTWTWNGDSPKLVATTGGLKLNAAGRVEYTRAAGKAKVTIDEVKFLIHKGVPGTNGYEQDPQDVKLPTIGAVTNPVMPTTISYQTAEAEPVKASAGPTLVLPAGGKVKVEVKIKFTVTDSDGTAAPAVTIVTLPVSVLPPE